jgi:hypothetical protein
MNPRLSDFAIFQSQQDCIICHTWWNSAFFRERLTARVRDLKNLLSETYLYMD